MSGKSSRRQFFERMFGVSAAAAVGGSLAFEDQALMAQLVKRSDSQSDAAPVVGLQKGDFCGLKVSRLIIGGNLISGSAHAGELLYQSALMTHYFNTAKILETWELAERNGVNTTLMRCDPHIIEHYNKYRKERGGQLQWIAQSAPEQGDPVENAKLAADNGAVAIYFHGGRGDDYVEQGRIDEIGEIVAGMKKAGLLAGVAGHKLETIRASEEAGIDPDFYMYTVNKVGYLSSKPDEIADYMKNVTKPWIGFKVLGAGRDRPTSGFKHAFEKGADFLCVGMFDWQVRDDVKLVKQFLDAGIERPRAWV